MTRSSNVVLGSSINAQSSPGQSPLINAGWFGKLSRPRALANRRAGSTVTTHVRFPRRAPSTPIAAATVVLPTPPDPQQTMIDLSVISSPTVLTEGWVDEEALTSVTIELMGLGAPRRSWPRT